MKAIQIITEPFQFLSIMGMEVNRKINDHSILTIQGLIRAEDEDEYLNHSIFEKQLQFHVAVSNDREENDFFHGVITDFSIQKEGQVCMLSLEVSGGTYLMDIKEHQRFYQRGEQTATEVFEEICTTYDNCLSLLNMDQDYPLQQFTVQYLETDWQFLKRIASRNHLPLVSVDHIPGIRFYVGISQRSTHEVNTNNYTILNDIEEYYMKSSRMKFHPIGSVAYQFTSRDIYHLGDQIAFNRYETYVYEILSVLEGGELLHHYKIKSKQGLDTVYEPNEAVIGASFDALITDIVKDQVLIQILNGENSSQNPAKLFPFSTVYSSPDGSGWYCMPEVGDTVRLYIPSSNEEDGYVISAVHQRSEDASARVNPEVKSLKTRYGKEVYFTPDSIVLTNHMGNQVTLHDLDGIKIESNHNIVFSAKGDVSFTSTEETLLMNAADKIDISQGGTVLTVEDDIVFKGGKLRME